MATNSSSAGLNRTDSDVLARRRAEAELLFRRIGITFAVYGEADAEERIIPFDIMPRVFTKPEWERLSRGLEQRVRALNAFLADVYGEGEIITAGLDPARTRLLAIPTSARRWPD